MIIISCYCLNELGNVTREVKLNIISRFFCLSKIYWYMSSNMKPLQCKIPCLDNIGIFVLSVRLPLSICKIIICVYISTVYECVCMSTDTRISYYFYYLIPVSVSAQNIQYRSGSTIQAHLHGLVPSAGCCPSLYLLQATSFWYPDCQEGKNCPLILC